MIATQILAGVFESVPQGTLSDHQYRAAKRVALEQKILREAAIAIDANVVDPRDAMFDPGSGQFWSTLGSGLTQSDAPIATEEELANARSVARNLASTNEFAINGHDNRINYIVGSGHEYTATPRKGQEVSDETLERVQAVIDEFTEANKWHKRQQEIVRRKDRDGECFLRLFPTEDGLLLIRFIEPGQVAKPQSDNRTFADWGIVTDPDDVETVQAYLVDGEPLDPSEVQHRKQGVDLNVKRGVPLFYPVHANLRRAEKLLRNMSVVAEVQAAIALIRRHDGVQKSTAESLVSDGADVQVTSSATNTTNHFKRYEPGTILDVPNTVEYDFPAAGIDASRYVLVLQAELRAVASRLVMPEFMLTSDASNSNYSSTMVAEGPAHKQFSRLQWDMIHDDLDLIDRCLSLAVATGRVSQEDVDSIEIVAEPPRVAVRERESEVNADMALVAGKVMSKRTAAIRQDLDPDMEAQQIATEREESDPFGGAENNPLFQQSLLPEPGDEGDEE